jgi:hypothetical protein
MSSFWIGKFKFQFWCQLLWEVGVGSDLQCSADNQYDRCRISSPRIYTQRRCEDSSQNEVKQIKRASKRDKKHLSAFQTPWSCTVQYTRSHITAESVSAIIAQGRYRFSYQRHLTYDDLQRLNKKRELPQTIHFPAVKRALKLREGAAELKGTYTSMSRPWAS